MPRSARSHWDTETARVSAHPRVHRLVRLQDLGDGLGCGQLLSRRAKNVGANDRIDAIKPYLRATSEDVVVGDDRRLELATELRRKHS